MTAGLETFAKVRAVHDRTDNAGEKAAAANRMKALARSAGMTVRQAVSKLDAPKPTPPRNPFEELFNTPEFRAQQAERQRRYADRRAVALAEYGSEDAVWAPNEREKALDRACRPLIVRKPIINGAMDTLQGWDGGRFAGMPPDVQAAVASAYAGPATVREAWAEFLFWEKIADERTAFCDLYEHRVMVRARTGYVEHLLDSLPATSLNDIRTRMDWMQHINERDWDRGNPEDGTLLATLRADIERMGCRLRDQDAGGVQNGCASEASPEQGENLSDGQVSQPSVFRADEDRAPGSGQGAEQGVEIVGLKSQPASYVQSGQQEGSASDAYPLRRTNAEKRRDVLALLNVGNPHLGHLTDREIARRAGVAPQTVGNIRRDMR